MKPSSSSGVGEPASIRLARFDRPLQRGAAHSWGDAEVDRQVRLAVAEGHEQGRAAGYAAGWSQGRQAAAAQAQEQARVLAEADEERRRRDGARLQTVLDGLSRVAADMDHALVPAWEEIADAVTEGALRIARAALGRELETLDDERLEAVRAAVRAIGDPATVTVRVHPEDHLLLVAAVSQLPPGLRLVADADLRPGEVRAITPSQRLSMHLPTALAAAEEVLRG